MRVRFEVGRYHVGGWTAVEKFTLDVADAADAKRSAEIKAGAVPLWYGATHVRFWMPEDAASFDLLYPDGPTPAWSR